MPWSFLLLLWVFLRFIMDITLFQFGKLTEKKSKMNINSTFKIYCNFRKMWMSLLASSPSDTFLAMVCSAATSKDYSYILLSKRKYPMNYFLHSFSGPIGVGDLNWYQCI